MVYHWYTIGIPLVYHWYTIGIPFNGIPLVYHSIVYRAMVYHSMPRGKPFKIPLDEWYFQWFSMVKYTVQNNVGLITSKYHSMVSNGTEWYFQWYFNDIPLTDFYEGWVRLNVKMIRNY